MFLVAHCFVLAFLSMQQPSEPPGVKYNLSFIAAAATLTAALIAAAVSIFGLFKSYRTQTALQRQQAELTQANQKELAALQANLTIHTQTQLEKAKAELAEQGKERDARRDYEYDARKRLYEQVEPIRFNLYEALEEAHYRVRSLVRTAHSGNLGIGKESWVTGPGYYLLSTIYKIFSPVVHFRLLQRRMTFIDFSLDRDIAVQYMLLKLYVRSFTDDFAFANLPPHLDYTPNDDDAEELAVKKLAVFSQQALYLGDLESIADLLTVKEDDETRALRFGEFERLFFSEEPDDKLDRILSLFKFFSPETKPVLARLLIAQAYFAELILSTYKSKIDATQLSAKLDELLEDKELQDALSWSESTSNFSFVHCYWQKRLLEQLGAEMIR
jgi:hypothetical protein